MKIINKTFQNVACALAFSAIFAPSAFANQCKSEIFTKYKQITKSEYVVASPKPDPDLLARMDAYEIICPWQVEQDFDGDGRRDWVGLVKKGNKYLLAGFVTGGRSAKAIEIKTYEHFPIRTHFDQIRLKEFALLAPKNKTISKTLKNGLVEYRIGKKALVYQWDGNTLEQVGSFEGNY